MSFKKFDGSTWQSINPKKLKGIPYTGTLPAVLTGTKAGYLHRYKIYGNTEQIGTPTPENPIAPRECGERTENLFDKNATDPNNGYMNSVLMYMDGSTASNAGYRVSEYISVASNADYYLTSVNGDGTYPSVCFYDENKDYISGTRYNRNQSLGITTPSGTAYLRMTTAKSVTDGAMLTAGSTTPTSYIPYGYKLPLTSAGQDVDIYLGEVETTRRIKKLVLTGEEIWSINQSVSIEDTAYFYTSVVPQGTYIAERAICSHFEYKKDAFTRDDNGFHFASGNYGLRVRIIRTIASTPTDFKAWLAAQYAAGTPVTVWYVLATPETGIVNEPLMKIGDYTDTISMEQAGVEIPTSAGSTTISWAGEGLAPSEFDSVQEWVDIPAYKRVNGEWVEDN